MNNSTTPTLNLPLLRRIRDVLLAEDQPVFTDGEARVEFDMLHYIVVEEVQGDVNADGDPMGIPDFCQTSCCLAGTAVLLSGRMTVREALGTANSDSRYAEGIIQNHRSIVNEACEALGFTWEQAENLFMWTEASRREMADHLTAMIDAGKWLPRPRWPQSSTSED